MAITDAVTLNFCSLLFFAFECFVAQGQDNITILRLPAGRDEPHVLTLSPSVSLISVLLFFVDVGIIIIGVRRTLVSLNRCRLSAVGALVLAACLLQDMHQRWLIGWFKELKSWFVAFQKKITEITSF